MPRPKITPCLWFDGKAEEAAKFYATVFPDSAITSTTPGPGGGPLVIEFKLAGCSFLGLNGGPQFQFNEAVSFSVDCKDQKEVDYYWEKLTEGGTPSQCGWLKDRYGVSWQIVPEGLSRLLNDKDAARVGRVVQALLQMRKLDIQALEDAAEGKSK